MSDGSTLQRALYCTFCFVLLPPLAACDSSQFAEPQQEQVTVTPKVIRQNEIPQNAAVSTRQAGKHDASVTDAKAMTMVEIPAVYRDATDDSATLPYPIYPNANRYALGHENGLQIVLLQTDDAFYEVDAFYRKYIDNAGLSRLVAMSDYVRYAAGEQDFDAWATDQPGIVIHGFKSPADAQRLGAAEGAQTNIIMSFTRD